MPISIIMVKLYLVKSRSLCIVFTVCLLTVLHEGRRCCLQYPVVVRPPDVFLHSTSPRVRVAEKESKDGFDPWDTDGLFTVCDHDMCCT